MRKLDEKSQNLLKVVVLGILLYFGFYYIESVSKAFSNLSRVSSAILPLGNAIVSIYYPFHIFKY